MHSHQRILQSSNTNTRKQKTSNHTEHEPKMTSNDLKMTSNEPVKKRSKKLKSDDPGNIHISGNNLIEQAFLSNQMSEFIEAIKKDINIQNEVSQTIEKYNKESFSTRSKKGQNALIQRKVFKQAIVIMGETISDMEKESEQKDNKIQFLEDKIRIPDSKVIEKMIRLDLNKLSN